MHQQHLFFLNCCLSPSKTSSRTGQVIARLKKNNLFFVRFSCYFILSGAKPQYDLNILEKSLHRRISPFSGAAAVPVGDATLQCFQCAPSLHLEGQEDVGQLQAFASSSSTFNAFSVTFLFFLFPIPRTGVETSEKDPEEDAEVPGGRRGGQCDNLQDCDGQRCQK